MSAPEKPSNPAEAKNAAPSSGPVSAPARAPGGNGLLGSLVRVERLIQLALVLPAATLIGWAIGLGLDRWLDRHWIAIAGLLFGAVAGFVEIFRVVAAVSKES